ncbi:MAG: hypothetical protein PHC64_03910 [Candidatus Gastranaerophilales bacterium]|nr:hypothetical protein [Candidatus Gastranaerophilales bacterium]
MDSIFNRTIDVTKLAMDGLMTRQKATASNIANVMTPDYQRKEVSFESQLKEIVAKDDLKTMIKEQNSMQYNPTSLDLVGPITQTGLTPQEARYLQSNIYSDYNPQIVDDNLSGSDSSGNNVTLEKEVMSMAGIGLKYNMLANLEQKQFSILKTAIKGD